MRSVSIIVLVLLLFSAACIPAYADEASMAEALLELLHLQGVIDDAGYRKVKLAGESGGEDAMSRQLVEILRENGTITDDAYKRLVGLGKAEKPADELASPKAPEQPSEVLCVPSAERPADKALGALEEGVARLGGNAVKLKIGAWLQGGYVYDNSGTNAGALPGASSFNADSGNSFHIRFARPYFKFSFREKAGFRIMLDAAGSPPLRDVFVWFDYIPYTRVSIGQFLTPFGSETWRAPFQNPMINYSLASTLMQFDNFRDTGIMVASKYHTEFRGLPFGMSFEAAVINGNGINHSDDNDCKDFIGRAWLEPLVPGLQAGGSWYVGRSSPEPGIDKDWDRWAAEVNYSPPFVKGLALRGEYLFQRRFYSPPGRMVHSRGWYVQAWYRPDLFEGGLSFLNDLEPAVRYEQLDEDNAVAENGRTRWTFGMNYWLNKYLRLLVNYEIIEAGKGLDPVTGSSIMPKGIDRVDHDVATTHLQVWF